jgi:hypothetical protein
MGFVAIGNDNVGFRLAWNQAVKNGFGVVLFLYAAANPQLIIQFNIYTLVLNKCKIMLKNKIKNRINTRYKNIMKGMQP